MDETDKEIFLNIFLGMVNIEKKTTPEAVHGALMQASGIAISPIVRNDDIPMYCASSIASAVNEGRVGDLDRLISRVSVGIEENLLKRRKRKKL